MQCPRKQCNAPEEQAPSRRRVPSISHAIPTRPDPTPTHNPQNSNDQTSNHETHSRELHAKLLGRQVQLPRNLARNSIGRSFNKVKKRCNSNDLNSMFERVAGELRAKLSVDSAAMCARTGHEGCGEKAGPGCGEESLAGLRDDAPSHTSATQPHRWEGHRRDLRRCRWAAAGPGRASRRRAERS